MANSNSIDAVTRKSICMDMAPPFRLYVDGRMVAEYATEDEAEIHYQKLRKSHLGKSTLGQREHRA